MTTSEHVCQEVHRHHFGRFGKQDFWETRKALGAACPKAIQNVEADGSPATGGMTARIRGPRRCAADTDDWTLAAHILGWVDSPSENKKHSIEEWKRRFSLREGEKMKGWAQQVDSTLGLT